MILKLELGSKPDLGLDLDSNPVTAAAGCFCISKQTPLVLPVAFGGLYAGHAHLKEGSASVVVYTLELSSPYPGKPTHPTTPKHEPLRAAGVGVAPKTVRR